MAKRAKKKAEAWKLEVDEIDRQLREIIEKKKELQKRKRELILEHTEHKRPWWDDDTPMVSLVSTGMRREFRQMIDAWQKSSKVEIDYRMTAHFEFKLVFKPGVIRALSKALQLGVFRYYYNNDVFRYLSTHSNLGDWDTIKREELRYREKVGTKNEEDS